MGEIVPKSFTLQHPERVALLAAGPISAFHAIFRPFIWVLVRSSAAVLRWFGVTAGSGLALVHSEEELKMLVTASREKGVLEEEEQEMLHKVFEFADKDAVDVMVPRPDVVARAASTCPVPEMLRLVLAHPFTRYPVYEGELDDIVGVLHVRDLFSALHERGLQSLDVRSILRDAIMVPETKPLDELLAEFQRTSNHLAIVVDEYGSVEGLVTLEDLLEEIVGEIGDEFDLPDAGVRCASAAAGCGSAARSRSTSSTSASASTCPTTTTTRSAGSSSASSGACRRWATRVAFDGARFEVSATDGPRIREVDVTLHAPARRRPARAGSRTQPARVHRSAGLSPVFSRRSARPVSLFAGHRDVLLGDPPALWFTQRSVTVSHETAMSGWWSASAAACATRFTNAIEPSKSPQEYAFSSAPSRTSQPCIPATCACSSDSASTGMTPSSFSATAAGYPAGAVWFRVISDRERPERHRSRDRGRAPGRGTVDLRPDRAARGALARRRP